MFRIFFPCFIVLIILFSFSKASSHGEKLYDKNHLKEDYEMEMHENKSNLKEENVEHYAFYSFDYNKDHRIDGLEIIKYQYHENYEDDRANSNTTLIFEEMENSIDGVLKEFDFNYDGFIDLQEYLILEKKNNE